MLKYKPKLINYPEAFMQIWALNKHLSKQDLELILDYNKFDDQKGGGLSFFMF